MTSALSQAAQGLPGRDGLAGVSLGQDQAWSATSQSDAGGRGRRTVKARSAWWARRRRTRPRCSTAATRSDGLTGPGERVVTAAFDVSWPAPGPARAPVLRRTYRTARGACGSAVRGSPRPRPVRRRARRRTRALDGIFWFSVILGAVMTGVVEGFLAPGTPASTGSAPASSRWSWPPTSPSRSPSSGCPREPR